MIHPDTELRYISPEIGYGVVAKKFIPKGTVTWVQDSLDTVYSSQAENQLCTHTKAYLNTYAFRNRFGEKVLCWDHGKYVNHSFRPTCFSTPYDFEIAIRDILPGEELTDDYGYLNLEKPFAALDEGTDRKIVYPDDLLTYHSEWDDLLQSNLPYVFRVQQPLLRFIPDDIWNEFRACETRPEFLPSLLDCYFDAKVPQLKLKPTA